MIRVLGVSLIGIAAFALAGCSQGPQCVPVSGKVTFNGGPVPGPGYIYFTTDPGKDGFARPGVAEFDATGAYRAQTFVKGDGLLPGKYVLRVDCWKSPPNMEGKPVVSFLPNKYQNPTQSGLELEVKPDSRAITFDVPLADK